MSQKKDMRRPELVIPYQAPNEKEKAGDLTSTLATTMPMAAMFTRNKFIGWASVVFAIQAWLSESKDGPSKSQPGILSVGMSFIALLITYLPLFLPPTNSPYGGTGTEAPAAAPPS